MGKGKKILIIISIILILVFIISEILSNMYINNINMDLKEFQNSEHYSSGSYAGWGYLFIIVTLYGMQMLGTIIIFIILLSIWIVYAIIFFYKKRKNKKIIMK